MPHPQAQNIYNYYLLQCLYFFPFIIHSNRQKSREADTIPIVFAAGQAEIPMPVETPPSKEKEALGEAAGYDNDYEHPMEAQIKSQDLGACGTDEDMMIDGNPPSYYEATKQTKSHKSDYEPLII